MKTLLLVTAAILFLTMPSYPYSYTESSVASVDFSREVFKTSSLIDLINLLRLRESVTVMAVSSSIPNNSVIKELLVYRVFNDSVDALITIGRYNKEGSSRDFIEAECKVGDSVSILLNEIRFYRLSNIIDNKDTFDENMLYRYVQRKSIARELGVDLPEVLYGFVSYVSRETSSSMIMRRSPDENETLFSSQPSLQELKKTKTEGFENVLISFIVALITALASYVVLRRLYL